MGIRLQGLRNIVEACKDDGVDDGVDDESRGAICLRVIRG